MLSCTDEDSESEEGYDKDNENPKKRPHVNVGGAVNVTAQAGAELVRSEEETWLPLFIMAVYRDEDMIWHVVLVIVLPSGVGYKDSNDVFLHTEKAATELVIKVTWPSFVVQIRDLHSLFDEKIQHTDDFIVRKRALMTRMAQMRPTANDALQSVARIPLPFEVNPDIPDESWEFIGSPNGTRVLYIDLKAPSTNTYKGKTVKDAKIAPSKQDTDMM